jgi:thymidylate kinase
MPIIYLFGPDGSGKSTLAKALTRRLTNKGFRVKISWMRGTHTLASLFARYLSNFGTFSGSDNPYYGIDIPRRFRRLWQLLEFTSMVPIILVRFMIPSLLGYLVVADRYIPDFIVWISVTTGDPHYTEKSEIKFLLPLSWKAQAKIYVTATLEELLRRRREADVKFIRDQLKVYEAVASAIQAHRINTTTKSTNDSLREALSIINLYLEEGE